MVYFGCGGLICFSQLGNPICWVCLNTGRLICTISLPQWPSLGGQIPKKLLVIFHYIPTDHIKIYLSFFNSIVIPKNISPLYFSQYQTYWTNSLRWILHYIPIILPNSMFTYSNYILVIISLIYFHYILGPSSLHFKKSQLICVKQQPCSFSSCTIGHHTLRRKLLQLGRSAALKIGDV